MILHFHYLSECFVDSVSLFFLLWYYVQYLVRTVPVEHHHHHGTSSTAVPSFKLIFFNLLLVVNPTWYLVLDYLVPGTLVPGTRFKNLSEVSFKFQNENDLPTKSKTKFSVSCFTA